MGLAVQIGRLADLNANDEEAADWLRERLKVVNRVLAENGLPHHKEPESLQDTVNRASIGSYPYSFLHYLRRLAAHASKKPDWKPRPFARSDDPADDPVVIDETGLLRSHLLCHSDCEGFYIPIDFSEPLFADDVLGNMLGSSQALMRELVAVAPFLGIQLACGELTDAEATRINGVVEAEGDFWIEHAVWISLFEAARLSVEQKTAICFS